jgi:hypothetical protein
MSSRGGTPLGKRVWRSRSRSMLLLLSRGRVRGVVAAAVFRLADPRLRPVLVPEDLAAGAVLVVRLLLAPVTPWARLRWAPSEAARLNVLPHSGHLNSSELVAAGLLVDLVRRGRAICLLVCPMLAWEHTRRSWHLAGPASVFLRGPRLEPQTALSGGRVRWPRSCTAQRR